MNINRYNYEEFFLLYVDNELSAEQCKEVETFVAANPDLEEELMMLKQSLLKPDASLVLEDKSSLFKSEKHSLINLENYETFFLLYVDEELSADERRAVESFASQHPAQQQELEILQQTRVIPDVAVVFPGKEMLYRKAGAEKLIVFKAWRIVAVAAMFILAVGILWLNSGPAKNHDFVKEEQKNEKGNEQVAKTTERPVINQSNEDKVTEKEAQKQNLAQVEENQRKRNKSTLNDPEKASLPQLADHSLDDSNQSELEDAIVHSRVIAKVDALEVPVQGSSNVSDHILIIDQPYEQPKPNENSSLTRAEGEPDELAIGPIQTKNKLRGLFRRVTRVVEKNTHIPTGENKRLLIGNLEIALK